MGTYFYFFECKETFSWNMLFKHTLKLKNISVYYYLQKNFVVY